MGYNGTDLLLKYLEKNSDAFNAVFEHVQKFAVMHKQSIFREEALQRGFINEEDTDINFKKAHGVKINEDTVEFDVIVEGDFMAQWRESRRNDVDDVQETVWFTLNCIMRVTDKETNLKVKNIDTYARKNYKPEEGRATASLVPIISREEYDREAESFLEKYYPAALTTPMPVPMDEVVANMGLTVVKDQVLTAEHAIFGQICFLDGEITVFDDEKRQYVKREVERGTIFIDPQTYFLRNLGCANNTLAHEAYHWAKHRLYATIKGEVESKAVIAQRCPTNIHGNLLKGKFSEDEQWLEKQANAIAPKILMPRAMTDKKVNELIGKYHYVPGGEYLDELRAIIDELADFFQVSKQAARIRMIELGYEEAAEVYNFEEECAPLTHEITEIDAFTQISENKTFQGIVDAELDLFRFVENRFVINSPKYIQYGEDGLTLTDYARENPNECMLEFQQNIEIIFKHNRERGVLCREFSGIKQVAKYATTEHNEEVVDTALAAEKFAQENEDTKELATIPTAAGCLKHLMEKKGWNSAKFFAITTLAPDQYSKIRNKPNRNFELPTLVTILICLGYDASVSRMIIQKAGFNMRFENEEERLYEHLLTNYAGKSIYDCNDIITEVNEKNNSEIRLLGSKEYDNTRVG